VSTLISVLLLRGKVKQEMYDNLSSEDRKRIMVRTLLFAMSMPMTMLGLKHFPVSVVRSAQSL
jgi:hypothetical protein